MKKIGLIFAWMVFSFACNSNRTGHATDASNMNDSSANKAAPTPGLGSDPTRNDASRPAPSDQPTADSTAGNATPTPGLGNDPTRNDASKGPLPANGKAASKQDSALRKN